MTYKVESLLERPDIKKNIIESLKRTKNTNREHVFNFCAIDDEIIGTDIEEGKKHTVRAENKCPIEGPKIIGAFHTHIRLTKNGEAIPSPRDIIKSIEEDIAFFCIGGYKGSIGIIRCFDKEDLLLETSRILEKTKKEATEKNIEKAVRHIVVRMITDKDYLDNHSFIKYEANNI